MPEYTDINDHEEDVGVPPNTNLRGMPFYLSDEICKYLEMERGLVQKLIATQDDTRYQLSDIQVHECLRQEAGACQRVLNMWGTLGMTVEQLVVPLNLLRQERSLRLLVDPIPLKLVADIPRNVCLEEGQTLQLKCEAEGFPYARYTWFRDKIEVTCNQIGLLEITNIGLNDTGTYICRIHNIKKPPDLLWTTKCEVYVTENLCGPLKNIKISEQSGSTEYPKSIHFKKQPPEEITRSQGQKLTLTLEAFGAPPLRYMWCKDGEVITQISDESTLQIPAVAYKDGGVYRCTVSNDGQPDAKSNECRVNVFLEVNFTDEPVIIRQPTDKEEHINGIAVFRVKVQSPQKLSYQWYHNGHIKPGCCSNELRLTVEKHEQAGEYQCQITSHPDTGSTHTIMSRIAKLSINKSKKGVSYFATDKLAILLGQANYRSNHPMLPAVKNDMTVAYEVFTDLGFKAISGLDNTLEEMNVIIDIAINMMKTDGNDQLYVVMYIVGHGFYRDGITYLMPSSAQEGTQVSNCLSFDEIEKRINRELHPELFFIISDVCQTEMNHVLQDSIPERSRDPYSKKKVVIRAATLGEESLEERVGSGTVSSRLDSSKRAVGEVPGWTDITAHLRCRGIFSKALFQVLSQAKRLLIHDLYKEFKDVFRRPNPKNSLPKGKEQNPVFEINLEADRSLFDPINHQGQEEQYEKRKIHYEALSTPPRNISMKLQDLDCWNIKGSFRAKASNVLELILWEEDKRPKNHPLKDIQVTYNILEQSVPMQVRPSELYRYPDDPDHGIKQKRGYIFYNLQQLQQPLQMILEISYNMVMKGSPVIEQYMVVPGYTLISTMWNLSDMSPVYRLRPASYTREACEHSEDDNKLSSIESCA